MKSYLQKVKVSIGVNHCHLFFEVLMNVERDKRVVVCVALGSG